MGFRYKKDKPALLAEMADVEAATSASREGLPEEAPGDESCEELEGAPMDVLHAEHEALALQYKAKQKMAEVKKLRNFYRRSESDSKKGNKGGKCFVCDEAGHYARDCPKVKAALATNPVLVTTSAAKGHAQEDHEWGLLEELCRSQHATDLPASGAYMVLMGCNAGGIKVSPKSNASSTMNPFETWWNMKELSRKVILDLGCMRNVVGVQWANDVVQEWQHHNRWFKVLPEEEVFRFGDGNTLKSKYRLQLEATFGGKRICLAFSVVGGPCPPLLSKQSHTILGVQLDTSQHTLSSRKLKVKNYGLQETQAGHYTMRIDEFHLLDDVWHVPQDFVMDSDLEDMFTMSVDSNDREVFGLKLARECRPRAPLDGHAARESPAMPPLRSSGSSDESMSGDVRRRGELRHDHTGGPSGGSAGGGSEIERPPRVHSEASPTEHGRGAETARSRSRSPCRSPSRNSEGDSSTKTETASPITTGSSSVRGRGRECGVGGELQHSRPYHGRDEDDLQETREAASRSTTTPGHTGAHGLGGEVSLSEQCLQRRSGLQCDEEHLQPAEDVLMEEAGVAAEGEDGGADRVEGEGFMEEESEVAEPPSELRSGVTVGSLRGDETAASEHGLPRPGSWTRVIPQRGLIQRFKQAVTEAKQRHVAVTKMQYMREHYLVLELFAGCARLTSMARSRDGWETMDPVDLIWLLIKIPLSRNGHSSRIKILLSRNFRELHVYLSRGPCWPTTPLMKIRSPPAKLRQRITDHFLVAF